MSKLRISLIVFFVIFFASCEFVPLSEYAPKPYDGAFTWERVVKNAEWKNRSDHAVVAYDNKLWVMGGYNPGEYSKDGYYEDVWSSENGEHWTLVTDNAPWKGRRSHSVVVFDDGSGDAMFLIGGFSVDEETGYRQFNNDVWKSVDGANWTLIKERVYPINAEDSTYTSDWFPRMDHATVVANHGGIDYIYIIGGFTMRENHAATNAAYYFNDVWRSTDGITWDSLAVDIGKRTEHAVAYNFDTGLIYIQGGNDGFNAGSDDIVNWDVNEYYWLKSTSDGINWNSEVKSGIDTLGFLSRTEHQLIYYKNSLWALPGANTSDKHFGFVRSDLYAIWTVDQANNWTIDSEGCDIDPRFAYGATVFKDKVWVIGGYTDSNGPSNDVWVGEIN